MNIGERIRARREELGLTLEAVAVELGVHRSTVMRYESGQTQRIPLTTIERLAVILKTTTEYLMGWKDESKTQTSPETDENVRALTRMYFDLKPDQKELLIKIAKTMCDIADEELKK